nr:hypothetical protein GW17_00015283 [Ipomoea batatas]
MFGDKENQSREKYEYCETELIENDEKTRFGRKKMVDVRQIKQYIHIYIPSHLGSPLCLFCNFGQLPVAVLLMSEGIRSLGRLKSMQSSLSMSPLSFPLLSAIVFLGGEGTKGSRYLVLQHVNPGLPTQDVANGKLHKVEWHIEHNAVKPDHPGPSPPAPLNSREPPVRIHSN